MEYTIEAIPLKTVRVPEIDLADAPAYCEALKAKKSRKASRKARTAPIVETADDRASLIVPSSKAVAHVGRHFVDNSVGVSFSTIFDNAKTYYQLFFDCTQERAQELIEELNARDNTTQQ